MAALGQALLGAGGLSPRVRHRGVLLHGDDLLLFQHLSAHGAMAALGQALLGAGGLHRRVNHRRMLFSGDRLLLFQHLPAHGAMAALGQTLLGAGRISRRVRHRRVLGFFQSLTLCDHLAALAAMASLGVSHGVTGGLHRRVNHHRMTGFGNPGLLRQNQPAGGAVPALGKAVLGAGYLHRLLNHQGVPQRLNGLLRLNNGIANAAMASVGPPGFGAGGLNAGVHHRSMAGGRGIRLVGVSAQGAMIAGASAFHAGGGGDHGLPVVMTGFQQVLQSLLIQNQLLVFPGDAQQLMHRAAGQLLIGDGQGAAAAAAGGNRAVPIPVAPPEGGRQLIIQHKALGVFYQHALSGVQGQLGAGILDGDRRGSAEHLNHGVIHRSGKNGASGHRLLGGHGAGGGFHGEGLPVFQRIAQPAQNAAPGEIYIGLGAAQPSGGIQPENRILLSVQRLIPVQRDSEISVAAHGDAVPVGDHQPVGHRVNFLPAPGQPHLALYLLRPDIPVHGLQPGLGRRFQILPGSTPGSEGRQQNYQRHRQNHAGDGDGQPAHQVLPGKQPLQIFLRKPVLQLLPELIPFIQKRIPPFQTGSMFSLL